MGSGVKGRWTKEDADANRKFIDVKSAAVAAGHATAEAKRRRKAMREVARTMLDTELRNNDRLKDELQDRGFQDYTEAAAVLLAQLNRARAGDTEAAKFLRDTSGQRPADQIAIGNLEDRPFETLDLTTLSDSDLKRLLELRDVNIRGPYKKHKSEGKAE